MAVLLADPELEAELRRQRRESGADKYDEVWDGVYVMHAYPEDEHQEIVAGVTHALWEAVQVRKLGRVRPGVNISANPADWKRDYRCPDVVAFLSDTTAECHGVFWNSADFVVEVVSKDDKSREKLDFYARVGVSELLLVDRRPWLLELYRHDGSRLSEVGKAGVGDAELRSNVLPLGFSLLDDADRPFVVVKQSQSGEEWRV
ncbi:Uma2 family endonuclease [Botrimarina sp.]|uniref:Uma2 family endonuclease n=1 Tax=Botrimarina sp. TaxID=2795802 RepID=UPI0032EBCCC3